MEASLSISHNWIYRTWDEKKGHLIDPALMDVSRRNPERAVDSTTSRERQRQRRQLLRLYILLILFSQQCETGSSTLLFLFLSAMEIDILGFTIPVTISTQFPQLHADSRD